MKELKEEIIEAVQDATDTVDGTVSIPILDHFLDGILTEQCNIANVSKRYFVFSGQENGKPTKYLVYDCIDIETAIAKIETDYPNFKWVMTETFNGC